MPNSGQPRALDPPKQKTICSLIAAGASLRQAARFIDCDAKTIRNEAARDDDFRRELAKARSEAALHPLETLHQAAKTNWRASVVWMQRIDPDRFARPNAAVVTQREANQFIADLLETIGRAVSSPQERKAFVELLTPAMPTAMRRRWNGRAMRHAVEQATHAFDSRKAEQDRRELMEKAARNARRRKLWHEIGQWLPRELLHKFVQNEDLFDPEEVFTQPPGPGPLIKDAYKTYKVGSIGATKYNPEIHDRPKKAPGEQPPN
jgi:hypothetical protein